MSFVKSSVIQVWARDNMPKFTPPSVYQLTHTLLPFIYSSCRGTIIEMINQMAFISFDTDCWSSANNKQFISLVGHTIFPDFKFEKIILETHEFKGSHTGQNLDTMINEMCRYWQVPQYKSHVAVHDNASNITLAIVKLSKMASIPCFIHSCQLIIKETILGQRQVRNVVIKAKRLARHLKQSKKSVQALEAIQKDNGFQTLKITQAVSTRWDSTIDMLNSILRTKCSVIEFLKEPPPGTKVTAFSKQQWVTMDSITTVFGILQEQTKLFSKEFTKASEIIPACYYVILVLRQNIENIKFATIKTTTQAILKSAIKRFLPYLKNINCVIATFLDPRYKMSRFTKLQTKDDKIKQHTFQYIRDELISSFKKYHEGKIAYETKVADEDRIMFANQGLASIREEPTDSDHVEDENEKEVTEHTRKKLHDMLINTEDLEIDEEEIRHLPELYETALKSEIAKYYLFDEKKPLDEDKCPFVWWRDHKYLFPHLSIMAMKYLSPPGASIASERLFSVSGQIIGDLRHNLSGHNTEMLTNLACNLPKLQARKSVTFNVASLELHCGKKSSKNT